MSYNLEVKILLSIVCRHIGSLPSNIYKGLLITVLLCIYIILLFVTTVMKSHNFSGPKRERSNCSISREPRPRSRLPCQRSRHSSLCCDAYYSTYNESYCMQTGWGHCACQGRWFRRGRFDCKPVAVWWGWYWEVTCSDLLCPEILLSWHSSVHCGANYCSNNEWKNSMKTGWGHCAHQECWLGEVRVAHRYRKEIPGLLYLDV